MSNFVEAGGTAVKSAAAAIAFALMLLVLMVGFVASGIIGVAGSIKD
ncbi:MULTISPECIES: hypothetical protein [unclassified Rhodococcus (in: high G+C Gram-positive bacteria)]|nr:MULTISPECIES: hypothetical protein [unclassified Rhodococcus (in: high G+C Gram-positive bacteria)]MDI9894561.1 hypothetical protein [Rhodococcus sp. IEGM 1381]MDV8022782.1 hypothetical protein [Rhodococcus sp. IEGM 1330]